MNSNTFIATNVNLEIYVNFANDFALVKPIDSKRDGLVIDNMDDKLVILNDESAVVSDDLVEQLKEDLFRLVTEDETFCCDLSKATIKEQIETIKTLVKFNRKRHAELELLRKY